MTPTTFTIPTLATERLILRGFTPEDVEHEIAFFATERSRLVGGPMPREAAWRTIAAYIGHWAIRGFGFWAIEDRETGRYLGRAGLWFPDGWPEPEIGWTLQEHAEGRGVAYEAALRARRFAYEELGWITAISMVLAGNTRSIALAERLGAVRDYDFEHERFGKCHVYRHPGPEALA
jgi:RimJ/RimL family protein N-acetyltransferase